MYISKQLWKDLFEKLITNDPIKSNFSGFNKKLISLRTIVIFVIVIKCYIFWEKKWFLNALIEFCSSQVTSKPITKTTGSPRNQSNDITLYILGRLSWCLLYKNLLLVYEQSMVIHHFNHRTPCAGKTSFNFLS